MKRTINSVYIDCNDPNKRIKHSHDKIKPILKTKFECLQELIQSKACIQHYLQFPATKKEKARIAIQLDYREYCEYQRLDFIDKTYLIQYAVEYDRANVAKNLAQRNKRYNIHMLYAACIKNNVSLIDSIDSKHKRDITNDMLSFYKAQYPHLSNNELFDLNVERAIAGNVQVARRVANMFKINVPACMPLVCELKSTALLEIVLEQDKKSVCEYVFSNRETCLYDLWFEKMHGGINK
jgi:hypothetical protein